jgi:hypothetical protein
MLTEAHKNRENVTLLYKAVYALYLNTIIYVMTTCTYLFLFIDRFYSASVFGENTCNNI